MSLGNLVRRQVHGMLQGMGERALQLRKYGFWDRMRVICPSSQDQQNHSEGI